MCHMQCVFVCARIWVSYDFWIQRYNVGTEQYMHTHKDKTVAHNLKSERKRMQYCVMYCWISAANTQQTQLYVAHLLEKSLSNFAGFVIWQPDRLATIFCGGAMYARNEKRTHTMDWRTERRREELHKTFGRYIRDARPNEKIEPIRDK